MGQQFHRRAQLQLLGLHIPNQAGIDYIPPSKTKGATPGYPLATSVVSSGGYSDDDVAEAFFYVGCGGLDYK